MAFLGKRNGLAVGAVLLFLAACLLPVSSPWHKTPFDHAVHVSKEELECRICHLFSMEGQGPTIPGPQVCRVCHKKFDDDKPIERRLDAYFDAQARYKRSRRHTVHDDIYFSHGNHSGPQGLECKVCHGDMSTAVDLPPPVGSKRNCMNCHAERQAPLGCDNCHKTLRKDSLPASHDAAWARAHGQVVRAGDVVLIGGSQNRCDLCHVQNNSCAACHLERQPKDHTHYFRNRGHGIAATIDRSRCATCHTSNSCDQCHQHTRPLSHRPGWAGTQQRHCAGCHLPLRGEGCRTCHLSTPGHATARPLPANHNRYMNCRQCHGAGASLPHPDTGGSCVACHL